MTDRVNLAKLSLSLAQLNPSLLLYVLLYTVQYIIQYKAYSLTDKTSEPSPKDYIKSATIQWYRGQTWWIKPNGCDENKNLFQWLLLNPLLRFGWFATLPKSPNLEIIKSIQKNNYFVICFYRVSMDEFNDLIILEWLNHWFHIFSGPKEQSVSLYNVTLQADSLTTINGNLY